MSRFLFPFLFCALLASGQTSGAEDAFSRTRHKAAALMLLCYNPCPARVKDYSCQRAQLVGLCRALVQEGGYIPARTAAVLEIRDPEVEHLALLVRELDGKKDRLARPGLLSLASTIALAYTLPSADGLRAAIHAGGFSSADPDQTALSRAAYSMVVYAIEGKVAKKDELIEVAAINAENEDMEQLIRAVNLREFRKLPAESTASGRFCRAVSIWRQAANFDQAMALGRKQLADPETMHFLGVLSAAWADLPNLPENFVWGTLQDKEVRDLCADLYELAQSGILSPVDPKLLSKDAAERISANQRSGAGTTAACPESEEPGSPKLEPLPKLEPVEALPPLSSRPMPALAPLDDLPELSDHRNRSTSDHGHSHAALSRSSRKPAPGTAPLPIRQPLMPETPAHPELPGIPEQPMVPATAATLTVTEITKSGVTEQSASILLPAMAPRPPLPQRPLPEISAPAPLSRPARPLPQAPETAEPMSSPAYSTEKEAASVSPSGRQSSRAMLSTSNAAPVSSTPAQPTVSISKIIAPDEYSGIYPVE